MKPSPSPTLPVIEPQLASGESLLAGLLNRTHAVSESSVLRIAPEGEKRRRYSIVETVKGKVTVEKELRRVLDVCAICGKGNCGCRPRSRKETTVRISYEIETEVMTVIRWEE